MAQSKRPGKIPGLSSLELFGLVGYSRMTPKIDSSQMNRVTKLP